MVDAIQLAVYNYHEMLYYEAEMAEIVDIAGYKKRRLAKIEAEWDQYMRRAEQFQREGKQKFAEEMLTKAKVLRKEIDRLRGPDAMRRKSQFLTHLNTMHTPISFTFDGMQGHISAYTKPPETP